jgi:hypothetical protein
MSAAKSNRTSPAPQVSRVQAARTARALAIRIDHADVEIYDLAELCEECAEFHGELVADLNERIAARRQLVQSLERVEARLARPRLNGAAA